MLINLILVVGLYIFVGNSGVMSFGHVSFMAIGAYTSALLTIPLQMKAFLIPALPGFLANAELNRLIALVFAGCIATIVAYFAALPLMRLTGIFAGIATFAFLVIVRVVLMNWDSITRGTGSMPGVPIYTTPLIALIGALAAMAGAYGYQESRLGRRLRASREDEIAAAAIGINVVRERRIAFALSAFFVGIGGGLFGHFVGVISPEDFYLNITFVVVAMLVVGGTNSLAGAVVGTLAVTLVSEALIRIETGVSIGPLNLTARPGLRETGLALFLLLMLILRPQGITGGKEIPWPGRRFRQVPEAERAASSQDANSTLSEDAAAESDEAGSPTSGSQAL